VIVARSEEELPALDELERRAIANGARVRRLDEQELAEVEPMARSAGRALFSEYTAQVDPRAVLKQLRADLEVTGKAKVLTGQAFLGLAGESAAETTGGQIAFDRFVNAAGAHCDRVARPFGVGLHYRLIPFKGLYRKLRPGRSFPVNGNIYPVPDVRNPFLGVHFTRSAQGEVWLGPTAIPALGRENYGLFRGADAGGFRIAALDAVLFATNAKFRSVALSEPKKYLARFFHRDAARLVRRYDPDDFEAADKVGIRPQLVDWRTKELVMDFVVEASGRSVHVLNPVSPAFTCSMALARQVVAEHFAH
jgi:(S)-2-hydroxyglutarate dehydrogenase